MSVSLRPELQRCTQNTEPWRSPAPSAVPQWCGSSPWSGDSSSGCSARRPAPPSGLNLTTVIEQHTVSYLSFLNQIPSSCVQLCSLLCSMHEWKGWDRQKREVALAPSLLPPHWLDSSEDFLQIANKENWKQVWDRNLGNLPGSTAFQSIKNRIICWLDGKSNKVILNVHFPFCNGAGVAG